MTLGFLTRMIKSQTFLEEHVTEATSGAEVLTEGKLHALSTQAFYLILWFTKYIACMTNIQPAC